MSLPEVLLWQQLRGQQLGVKFRKGYGIGPYVVDFYCCALRLAIEVDGEAHGRGGQAEHDSERDRFICENGHEVLRIPAVEVLRNLGGVIQMISLRVTTPLRRSAPPPLAGEE